MVQSITRRSCLVIMCSALSTTTAMATELFVNFRLEKQLSREFSAPAQARELADRLSRFGVEVETVNIAGKTTVRYRCPSWKFVEVDNDDAAENWKRWFKELGFEVKIQQ